ncbi:PdaC/SigV domain-containing protein [Cohnella lupini]|uniref:Copper amine oxidase-like protein n=1 Tax=Cohnella lupini TaxID=1294267 RepID=A0A3D9ISB9_9BACL|nr:DUF4163 domain-containing protein [Cohnella lupini]RED64588.1 copper amine oxidase-like protein [Cohnella lupini]
MMNKSESRALIRGVIGVAMVATLVSVPLLSNVQQASATAVPAYKIIKQPIEIAGARTEISALNTDNTNYIAVRGLNASIGLNTKWDKIKNTVTVTGRDRVLVLNLKSGGATLNNQTVYGLTAIAQNNTTYLPLRDLLERMGFGVSYDAETKVVGIEAIEENDIHVATAVIKEDGARKSLLINYPQLSGFSNDAVQSNINSLLKSEAEAKAEAAREALAEAVKGLDDSSVTEVSFDGTYTITYNEQGKLSLYVDYYSYTGGAHGLTVRVPYTFDLASGELITLKEAAGGDGKYVSIINDKIKSQIEARGLDLIEPFKTIEPDREFFLKHNGIVITFGQYEYTPYAAGMPEFEIPFEDFNS